MLVAGSGALVNRNEVLTQTQRARLAQARASDKTVMIRTPDEVGDPASRPTHGGTQTWRFHMDNTRDVAFTASPAFVWDAARINLPDGKTALAHVGLSGRRASGKDRLGPLHRIHEGRRRAFLASAGIRIPGRRRSTSAGPATGMEYPGIVFDGIDDEGKTLFCITAHEIGHSWFPMIVGSDERRDAWMDEGFNTFIDVYESDDFNERRLRPQARRRICAEGRQSGRRDPAAAGRSRGAADADPRRRHPARSTATR